MREPCLCGDPECGACFTQAPRCSMCGTLYEECDCRYDQWKQDQLDDELEEKHNGPE